MKTKVNVFCLLQVVVLVLPCRVIYSQTICFQRNGAIWLSDISGARQRSIVSSDVVRSWKGQEYRISPDGKYIAFQRFIGPTGSNRYRAIALYSIDSSKSRLLDNAPTLNNYKPIWSPDGSFIAFTYPHSPQYGISIIRRDNTGYTSICDSFGKEYTVFSYAWSTDSKSLICLIDSLHNFSIEGKHISSEHFIDTNSDTTSILLSTATNMAVSTDNKTIAFDGEICDNGSDIYNSCSAIWLYDRETRAVTRITPQTISAGNPNWSTSNKSIIYGGYHGGKKNIYIYDLQTKKTKLLIGNAEYPSLLY